MIMYVNTLAVIMQRHILNVFMIRRRTMMILFVIILTVILKSFLFRKKEYCLQQK